LRMLWCLHSHVADTCRVIVEAWFLWCRCRAACGRLALKPQAFPCLDTGERHIRSLSFLVQSVLKCDPRIAVPMYFAVVGKLAQTVFPGSPIRKLRESVIDDVFPSCCRLYRVLWFAIHLPSLELSLYFQEYHSARGFCNSRQPH
jgi:hypothetical protein